ncbi:hypothetical protein TNCV_1568701 [Trichonephila clavipes]|nr:hypothetical protein TNCV_1568701 [Trichonephila clavipes]
MRYSEILEPYVRLFKASVGPVFLLMENNARSHCALLVDDYCISLFPSENHFEAKNCLAAGVGSTGTGISQLPLVQYPVLLC